VECLDDTYSWEGNVLEGPSVLKHNGVYYCLYSTRNYQDVDYAVNYATASSPTGPWTKAPENPILQQPRADLAGTGHGAFFTDKNGQLRYVFHAHYSPTTVHPRKMYITDMNITDDGKIVMDKNSIICAKEYR
ncbi:MAG: family 43 glycosylhydrolase, partial [Bacteroidales bacterium]|jgi:beta-xylosidase|nr:family 43 glycosylhydrolase [Bacteroidales bacterium]